MVRSPIWSRDLPGGSLRREPRNGPSEPLPASLHGGNARLAWRRGCFVRSTVFANVTADMTVAREEMFGPVVSLIPYDGVDEAIETVNDTPYGLAAYLQSRDFGAAKRVASKLRAGQVMINHPAWDASAPFGGFRQSSNGRECGESGFEAFLVVKAIGGLLED